MKNWAQTYINISRSQFNSACFHWLCLTLSDDTWFQRPTTRISDHFSVICSMLFLFASYIIFSIIIMVGLVWSIHFCFTFWIYYFVLKWKRWENVVILWTHRTKMKMHLLHFICHWKSMALGIGDIDIVLFHTTQFPMRQYSNDKMTIIIVYNWHVHICLWMCHWASLVGTCPS